MVNQKPLVKWSIVTAFNLDGKNKTEIGRDNGVSPRTVGRIINEYETQVVSNEILLHIFDKFEEMVVEDNLFSECSPEAQTTLLDLLENGGLDNISVDDELTVGDIIECSYNAVDGEGEESEYFPVFDEEEDDNSLCVSEEDDVEGVDEVVVYNLVATPMSITVTKQVGDVVDSQTLSNNSDAFAHAWKLIRGVDGSNQEAFDNLCEELYILAQPKEALKRFSHGNLDIDIENKKITYRGHEVKTSLVDRIILGVTKDGADSVKSHLNFLDKLLENPSYRAANSLYDFIEHNDIVITEDGDFIAWKVVLYNYFDKHSGSFDNSVGQTVSMPRWQVEEDPNKTCSAGLHVCARHYVGTFGGGSDRLMKCRVNPKDVVAIPVDYNNSKMRVCRYEVVGEDHGGV